MIMNARCLRGGLLCASLLTVGSGPLKSAAKPVPDWREITQGWTIPSEMYTDQPYIVKCDDGAWLCVVTTSKAGEGAASSHVVSARSIDHGRTWAPLVAIEPSGPPESAYVTAVKVPSGRIYAFYDHNTDNIRSILRFDGKTPEPRVDSMGHFVFRYTDDNGKTWSPRRYEIPIRETEVDRNNVYHGRIRFFWHVGRPLIHRDAVYVTLHKIGSWPMDHTEGNFLRSDNLLTERDPAKIRWETLPDGDIGLRPPAGTVGEEQSIVDLSDHGLFTTFRTITGYAAQAYSHDDGHTFTAPAYLTYTPGGQKVKNSRAANFVWNVGGGRYLYWFENNAGKDFSNLRDPAWILAGREVDTPQGRQMAWSQPEILLYGDSSKVRMSYPDFVHDDGRYYVTETQKVIARTHEIPAEFLEMIWHQHQAKQVTKRSLEADLSAPECAPGAVARIPAHFDLTTDSAEGGLTVDLWLKFADLAPHQVIADARDAAGVGFALATTERGTVELQLRGTTAAGDFAAAESRWDTDAGLFNDHRWHHLVAVVDNGPRIVSFVVDGKFNDGGEGRPVGWARYNDELQQLPTSGGLKLAPDFHGEIRHARIYSTHLRTSEAIGNWRAEFKAMSAGS